jgi:phosphohistidine phosphatase
MKTLYLIRHAKSGWKDYALSDIDRPLNKRGKRDSPVMGKRLKAKQVLPDSIISSPAVRAFTTAKAISTEIGFDTEKIIVDKNLYECNSEGIIDVIKQTEITVDSLFVFGHNPEFTHLADFFTNEKIPNIPTCGIFCINFEVFDWIEISPKNAEFVFFDFPKNDK